MKAQGLDALEKTVGAVFIAGVTVAEVRERLLARATQNGDPLQQQPSANPTSNHQHPPTISYATYAAEFYNGANAWFGTAEVDGHHVALTSSNDAKTHTTVDAVGTHLRAPSQRPWLPPPLLPTHPHPMNYAPLPSHENARPTAEPVNLLPRAALMDFLGHAESAAFTGLQHYDALQHHHALQQPSSWAASPAAHVPHGPAEARRHGSPTCDLMFGHAKELYSLINHPTATCASASTASQPVLVPRAATATGTLGRAASLAMTVRDKASVAKGAPPAAPQWERGGTTPSVKASMPTAKTSRPRQRVNTADAAPPVPGSSASMLLTNSLPPAAAAAAAAEEVAATAAAAAAAEFTPAAASAVVEASATPTASPAAATPAAEELELGPKQSSPCSSDPCETERLSPSCPAATPHPHRDHPDSAVCITQAPPSPPSPSAGPSPQQPPLATAADAPLAAGSACTTSEALPFLEMLEVADEAATAATAPRAAAAATASVVGSAALKTMAATTVAGLDRFGRPGAGMEGWAAGGIRSDSLLLPCIAATPSTPPSAPHQLGACCCAAVEPAPLQLIAAGERPGLPPAAAGPDQAIKQSPLDQTSWRRKPFAAEAGDLVVSLHQAWQSQACWAAGTPANVPAPAPTLAPAPAPAPATALTSAPPPTPAPSPPSAPAPPPAPTLSPLSPPAPPQAPPQAPAPAPSSAPAPPPASAPPPAPAPAPLSAPAPPPSPGHPQSPAPAPPQAPTPTPPQAPAPAPLSAPAPPPAPASSPLSTPVPAPTPPPTPAPTPAPAPALAPTPHSSPHCLQPPDLKVAEWDQGPSSHLLRCHSHMELAPAGCMSPSSEPHLPSCQATPPPAPAPPCLVQAKSMAEPAPGQGESSGLVPTYHPSCTLTAAAALPPAKQADPTAQSQPTAAVAVAQNLPRTQPEAQPSLPQPAAAPPAPPSPPNLHTQPAAVVLEPTAPAPGASKLLPSTSPFMAPAAQQATMRCASLPAHPCQPGPSDLATCHQLLQPAAAAALTLSAISTEAAVGCTPAPRPPTTSTSPQHNHSPAPSSTSPPAGWALLPVRTSPPQPSLKSQSTRQCSTTQPLPQSSRQCSADQPQLQCCSRQSSTASSLASLPCLTAATSPGSAWSPRPHLPRHHPHSDPGLDSPRACCSQAPSSPPSCSLPSLQSPPRPVRQGRRASTTNYRYIGQLHHKPQPSAGPVPLPLPPLEVFQQQAWLCEQGKPSRWPSLVPAPGLTASLHLSPVPDTVQHCPKRAATLPAGLELPPETGCHLAPPAAAPQPTLSNCLPPPPCRLTHLHSAPSFPSLRHSGSQHPHTQPALPLPAPAGSPDRSSLPLRLTPSTVQELVMRLEAYAPCTSPGPAPPRLLVKSLSSSKSSRSCTQHFSVPKDPRWARSRTVSHQAWVEAERAQGHGQRWGAPSSQASVVHTPAGAGPMRTPLSAQEGQACRPSDSPSSCSSISPAPTQGQLAKVDVKRSSHPMLGGAHSRSAAASPRSPVALSRPAAGSAGGSAGDSSVVLRPVLARTPPLRASSQTSIGDTQLCSTWPRAAQPILPAHPAAVSPVAQQRQGQQQAQQQRQQQVGQQGQQQEERQRQEGQQTVHQHQYDGRQLVSSDEEAELGLRLRQARLTRGSSESGLTRHPPALVSEVPCGMTARHWNALCRRSTVDGLPRSSSSSPSPLFPPPPPPCGPGTLHPTTPCPPAFPDPVTMPLPSPGFSMQQGGCTAVASPPGELLRSHPIAWDPCSDTSTSCRTSSPSDTPSPPPAASPVGPEVGSELPASLPAAPTTATFKNGTRRIETMKAPAVAVALAAAGVAAATAAPAAAGVAAAAAGVAAAVAAAAAPVAVSIGDSAASGLVTGEPGSWPPSKTSTPHSACTTHPPASTSATHPVKAAVKKYFVFRRRSKPLAAAAQAPALSPPLPASQQAGLPLPPARSVTLPAHSRSHPRSLQPLQEGAVQGGKRTANLVVRGGSSSGEERAGSCTSCMPFHRSWRP